MMFQYLWVLSKTVPTQKVKLYKNKVTPNKKKTAWDVIRCSLILCPKVILSTMQPHGGTQTKLTRLFSTAPPEKQEQICQSSQITLTEAAAPTFTGQTERIIYTYSCFLFMLWVQQYFQICSATIFAALYRQIFSLKLSKTFFTHLDCNKRPKSTTTSITAVQSHIVCKSWRIA